MSNGKKFLDKMAQEYKKTVNAWIATWDAEMREAMETCAASFLDRSHLSEQEKQELEEWTKNFYANKRD